MPLTDLNLNSWLVFSLQQGESCLVRVQVSETLGFQPFKLTGAIVFLTMFFFFFYTLVGASLFQRRPSKSGTSTTCLNISVLPEMLNLPLSPIALHFCSFMSTVNMLSFHWMKCWCVFVSIKRPLSSFVMIQSFC